MNSSHECLPIVLIHCMDYIDHIDSENAKKCRKKTKCKTRNNFVKSISMINVISIYTSQSLLIKFKCILSLKFILLPPQRGDWFHWLDTKLIKVVNLRSSVFIQFLHRIHLQQFFQPLFEFEFPFDQVAWFKF